MSTRKIVPVGFGEIEFGKRWTHYVNPVKAVDQVLASKQADDDYLFDWNTVFLTELLKFRLSYIHPATRLLRTSHWDITYKWAPLKIKQLPFIRNLMFPEYGSEFDLINIYVVNVENKEAMNWVESLEVSFYGTTRDSLRKVVAEIFDRTFRRRF